MKRLDTVGRLILGDLEKISSERYFVTLVCISASFFLLILSILHLIMGLELVPVLLSLGFAVILLFLYYRVRFKECLFYPKLIITVLGLLALDATWYTKYLSAGPVLYFILSFGALVIWFWDKKSLAIMLIFYALNLVVLFCIEYTRMGVIMPYENLQERTLDIYLSFSLYSLLTILILYMLKKDFYRQQEKAAKADKLKNAFLANISHEIRTPMNAIYGFSKLLEEENNPEEKLHYTKIIQRSSESLLKIINDIVDLSKIEAGYIQIELTDFRVKELFDDLERTFSKVLFEKGKEDVVLTFALPSDDLVIHSDVNRVRQVLTNLLQNAFKFTTRGKITVTCTPGEQEVVFAVSDTGTGIPKEDQRHIFRQFVKYNYSGLNKEGSGIGLSVISKILPMLKGRIWFESQWGKGTTFFVALPYKKDNPES